MTTETLEAPVETVTKIGGVEALRLGRLMRPYSIPDRLFFGTQQACAIGAIALGLGMPDPGDITAENDGLEHTYHFVADRLGINGPDDNLMYGIWHANDYAPSDDERDALVIEFLMEHGL